MQVNERNMYLKRLNMKTPHKYSFDMNSGKYYLITFQGHRKEINSTGTFKPNFRKSFTGFVGAQQRYTEAKKDPSALHYTPDLKFNLQKNYFCIMPDKFAGYAQFPYKLGNFPSHLQPPQAERKYVVCNSQHQKKRKLHPQSAKTYSKSIVVDTTQNFPRDKSNDNEFFQLSMNNMSSSKPLPRNRKKSCYNYKCKYLQQVNFSTTDKNQQMTKYSGAMASTHNTWGKSFHTEKLKIEGRQSQLFVNKIK